MRRKASCLVFNWPHSFLHRFIRRRFNWPSEFPDNFDVDDTPKPKRTSSEISDRAKSFKDEDLLHIRSLRVFEAIKA